MIQNNVQCVINYDEMCLLVYNIILLHYFYIFEIISMRNIENSSKNAQISLRPEVPIFFENLRIIIMLIDIKC